jgi:hypothetical protein
MSSLFRQALLSLFILNQPFNYSERQKKVVIACAAFSREIPPSPFY